MEWLETFVYFVKMSPLILIVSLYGLYRTNRDISIFEFDLSELRFLPTAKPEKRTWYLMDLNFNEIDRLEL